jgi:hypothetical protein
MRENDEKGPNCFCGLTRRGAPPTSLLVSSIKGGLKLTEKAKRFSRLDAARYYYCTVGCYCNLIGDGRMCDCRPGCRGSVQQTRRGTPSYNLRLRPNPVQTSRRILSKIPRNPTHPKKKQISGVKKHGMFRGGWFD